MLFYQIELPLPPSANRMWRMGKGHIYPSKEYKSWIKECEGLFLASGLNKGLKTIQENYKLHILLGNHCRLDGDNTFKPVNDFLQRVSIVANDKKCRNGQFEFGEAKGCIVTIEEL